MCFVYHPLLIVYYLFGKVVMKIIKHSRETPGTAVGLLVGLDLDGTLEISNSFGLPVSADNDEKIIKTSGLCTYCIPLYCGQALPPSPRRPL
jgi:JAB1/Mov34/MPN/PAD-1 ubiquitin protease